MKKDVSREKIKKAPDLTAFQKKVLIAVAGIPEGKVRSYAWVARKAGYPRASRAVGQALKKNPYAPHVPCHRVVASDGSIGGYSRGVTEKKKLLEKEGIKWS
ncbi:MAG: MGMT family protein [Candidatus Omnitrophota bacterium]